MDGGIFKRGGTFTNIPDPMGGIVKQGGTFTNVPTQSMPAPPPPPSAPSPASGPTQAQMPNMQALMGQAGRQALQQQINPMTAAKMEAGTATGIRPPMFSASAQAFIPPTEDNTMFLGAQRRVGDQKLPLSEEIVSILHNTGLSVPQRASQINDYYNKTLAANPASPPEWIDKVQAHKVNALNALARHYGNSANFLMEFNPDTNEVNFVKFASKDAKKAYKKKHYTVQKKRKKAVAKHKRTKYMKPHDKETRLMKHATDTGLY